MFRVPACPADLRITRITYAEVVGASPKMIGKNAVRDDHGQTAVERLVRLFTNGGHEGFGVTRLPAEAIEAEAPHVLGADPFTLVDERDGITMRGVEHALWDLIGRVAGQPVYALLGERRRDAVPAYDGGLYFCDLLYPDQGLARLAREAEESVAQGHRAVKMKIGRGHKWMPPREGFRRDIDAIRTVRQTIGPDVQLMVDGNNGFDRAGAERLVEAAGDQNLYWAEEMFPETLEDCARFRAFLNERSPQTYIADGETLPEPSPLMPFIERRLIDVVQLDMTQIGLSAWRKLAAVTDAHRLFCAPHTWASMFGLYATLHLGMVIPNFLSAEVPAYVPEAYHPAGITFGDGAYTVSDTPGWGLTLDETLYRSKYRAKERSWAL